MKPGRELDALVAEKIMGWDNIHYLPGGNVPFGRPNDDYRRDFPGVAYSKSVLPYSTDIAAAWPIIIKMRELGFGFTISDNANRQAEHIDCRFWHLDDDMRRGIAIENEAPLAICLAALEAVGVEVEDE